MPLDVKDPLDELLASQEDESLIPREPDEIIPPGQPIPRIKLDVPDPLDDNGVFTPPLFPPKRPQPPQERSFFGTVSTGFQRGLKQTGVQLGEALSYIGAEFGSPSLESVGERVTRRYEDILALRPELQPALEQQGRPFYHPERLAESIAESAPLTLGAVGAGIVTAAATGPVVGAVAGGAIFGGVSAGQILREAEEAGVSREQALENARLAGFGEAALEFVPGWMFLRLLKTGKAIGRVSTDGLKAGVNELGRMWKVARETGEIGLAEGIEEGLQTAKDNLIARGSWDPKRDILKDVAESALVGMAMGTLLGVSGAVVGTRKSRTQQRVEEEGLSGLRDELGMAPPPTRSVAPPAAGPVVTPAPAEPGPRPPSQQEVYRNLISQGHLISPQEFTRAFTDINRLEDMSRGAAAKVIRDALKITHKAADEIADQLNVIRTKPITFIGQPGTEPVTREAKYVSTQAVGTAIHQALVERARPGAVPAPTGAKPVPSKPSAVPVPKPPVEKYQKTLDRLGELQQERTTLETRHDELKGITRTIESFYEQQPPEIKAKIDSGEIIDLAEEVLEGTDKEEFIQAVEKAHVENELGRVNKQISNVIQSLPVALRPEEVKVGPAKVPEKPTPAEVKKPIEPKPKPIPYVVGKNARIVAAIREDIRQGEPGGRIFEEAGPGEGGGAAVTGYPSTYPEYFRNKGYGAQETLGIIQKVETGLPVTDRQKAILEDLVQGKRAELMKELKVTRKAERQPREVVAGNLAIGDEFTIRGDKFTVERMDEQGNVVVKNSQTFVLDPFDKILIDKGKAGVKKSVEAPPPIVSPVSVPAEVKPVVVPSVPLKTFNLPGGEQVQFSRAVARVGMGKPPRWEVILFDEKNQPVYKVPYPEKMGKTAVEQARMINEGRLTSLEPTTPPALPEAPSTTEVPPAVPGELFPGRETMTVAGKPKIGREPQPGEFFGKLPTEEQISLSAETTEAITPEKAATILQSSRGAVLPTVSTKPQGIGTIKNINTIALSNLFQTTLAEGKPLNKLTVMKRVADALGVKTADLTPENGYQHKQVEEAMEYAIVKQARAIMAETRPESEKYEAIKTLYRNQPILATRTSTSILGNQYSTPAPLAYLMNQFLDIGPNDTVLEPTAGNGMLVIGVKPDRVVANDIDPLRLKHLKDSGFNVTTGDDARELIRQHPDWMDTFDRVIMNPPFGNIETVSYEGFKISKLEHQIALEGLRAMKDEGKAALIIGGHNFDVMGHMTETDRVFLNYLYSRYNVTRNIEIDGSIFSRMGASYPIRLLMIEGRKATPDKEFAPTRPSQVSHVDLEPPMMVREGEEPPVSGKVDPLFDKIKELLSRPTPVKIAVGGKPREAHPAVAPRPPSARLEGERGEVRPAPVRPPEAGVRLGLPTERGEPEAGRPGGVEPAVRRREGELEELPPPVIGRGVAKPEPRGALDRLRDREPGLTQPNEYQTPYIPKSKGEPGGNLIPRNMRDAVQGALTRLTEKHGDLDKYVQAKLGYASQEAMFSALSAEQVDGSAMAIDAVDRGKAVIIGDQTGVGKGRTAAALILYANRQGLKPIFFTANPKLFSDIYRDLTDIGHPIRPFIMHNDKITASIVDTEGKVLFGPSGSPQIYKAMEADPIKVLEGYDAVLVPYSQVQVKNLQQRILGNLAKGNIIILDESHYASGESVRGAYLRDILKSAKAVLYLSATYAKRPDTMSLYFRTSMGDVGLTPSQLTDVMIKGGVPLQQLLASQLADGGEYIRRELDFGKVIFRPQVDTVNETRDIQRADAATTILREIVNWDRFKQGLISAMDNSIKEMGIRVTKREDVAAGVTSSNFTATVHNVISQLLLSLKADSIVDTALKTLREDKKPVINVMNTMESFLNFYVENAGVSVGDPVGFTFKDVFKKALESTLYYTEAGEQGNEVKRKLVVEELPPQYREAYQAVLDAINRYETDLPASPIDYIKFKIEDAGFPMGEITGRSYFVDYSTKVPTLSKRTAREVKDRNKPVNDFNSGRTAGIIFNSAGSAGLSIHASGEFKDQRQRVMSIAQPDLNIDTFVQALGRIFRKGQVVNPEYNMLQTALPAEIRPAVVLTKKMASLNANITANQDSATRMKDVPDMLNVYGDKIVLDYLRQHPDMDALLGHISQDITDDRSPSPKPDAMRKVTGRVALLPVAIQREFYEHIEAEYTDFINYLDQIGENNLIAKNYDFKAKTLKRIKIHDGTNEASPFTASSYLEQVSIQLTKRPYPRAKITELLKENLKNQEPEAFGKKFFDDLRDLAETYRVAIQGNKAAENILNQQVNSLEVAADKFTMGHTYSIPLAPGYDLTSVLINMQHSRGPGSPVAASKIKFIFAVTDNLQTYVLPLSRYAEVRATDEIEAGIPEDWDTLAKSASRENRYILTGNILQAIDRMEKNSEVITYTDEGGRLKHGILIPKTMKNPEQHFTSKSVGANQAIEVLMAASYGRRYIEIQSSNDEVILKRRSGREDVIVSVPKGKMTGAKYYLNDKLRDLVRDREFVSFGQRMEATVTKNNIRAFLQILEQDMNIRFLVPTSTEEGGAIQEEPAVYAGRAPYEKGKAQAIQEARQAVEDLAQPRSVRTARGTLAGAPGGVSTLGLAIRSDLIKNEYVDLRGHEVKSPEDLAVLAQIYRDPRFETIRFFYIKDKKVVAHEGVTLRFPHAARTFTGSDLTKEIFKLKVRMARLGADSFYILHNHPSGDPTPSFRDVAVARFFNEKVKGFKGHVVIDSGKWGFISINKKGLPTSSIHKLPTAIQDQLLTPEIAHELLGKIIAGPVDVLAIGKALKTQENFVTLLYRDSKGRVRAIQEMPVNLFARAKEAQDYIRGRARVFGTPDVFAYYPYPGTENLRFQTSAQALINNRTLKDAIHGVRETVRVSEVQPTPLAHDNWMGRLAKGIRVSEEGAPYENLGQTEERRAKQEQTGWEPGLSDRLRGEVTALGRGLDPRKLPYNTVFENALRSPEWYNHPILKQTVGIAIERGDWFHELFTKFNADPTTGKHVSDATVELAKIGLSWFDFLRGRRSEAYQQLQELINRGDEQRVVYTLGGLRAAGYSEAVIRVWQMHRDLYDRVLDAMIAPMRQLLVELEQRGAKIPVIGMMFDENGKRRPVTLKTALKMMGQYRGTYAPRVRESGEYVVQSTKEGPDGVQQRYRYHKSTRWGAERLRDKLIQQGHEVLEVATQDRLPEEVYENLKVQEIQIAIEKAMKGVDVNDPEMKLEFLSDLVVAMSDLIKARGFRSTMIRRKPYVVKGYIEDPLERMVLYTTRVAGGMAKARAAQEMFSAFFGTIEEGKRVGGVNPAKEPRVYATGRNYIIEQLRNADPTDRKVATLKSIATFKFLGFGVKTTAVNLTSLLTTAPAALHEYAGKGQVPMHQVARILEKATRDYGKVMAGKSSLGAEEQAFIQHQLELGGLEAQYTRDAIGSIEGAYGKTWAQSMKAAMWLFGTSEKWIRGSTILAGYRIARQQGAPIEAASLIAREASNRAHGIYGKATLPAWAQGTNPIARLGQLFYVFSKFPHNYIQLLYDMGFKRKNIKAFLYALASPIVIAGGAVIPLKALWYGIIGAMLAAIGEDRDPEKLVYDTIRHKIGPTGERLARFGLFGAAGIDVTGSLAIGMGVPKSLFDITGAAGGVIQDFYEGIEQVRQREYAKAGERILPTAFANLIRANRELKGATTWNNKPIFDEQGRPYVPGGWETFLRTLSATSARRGMLQQQLSEIKREEKIYEDKRDKIYQRYRAYLLDPSDTARLKQVMQDVWDYNDQAKAFGGAIPFITRQMLLDQVRRQFRPTGAAKKALMAVNQ